MKISSNILSTQAKENHIKTNSIHKITKTDAEEIRKSIFDNANSMMFKSTGLQVNILSSEDKFIKDYNDFQSFLSSISYEGKPISDLSKEEASELISDDGMFGISQTSQRIASFVINNANGDEDRLRAGREGIFQGFKMAEDIWGSKLPEISQKTMQKSIEILDNTMQKLGFLIINKEV